MDTEQRGLDELINSTVSLLSQFATNATDIPPIDNPPNPLQVLHDAAKLLKAHTTKLGLLAINKPFTPSAVRKVLREVTGTCLPALMSGAQICKQQEDMWSEMMVHEVNLRLTILFRNFEALLREIQSIPMSKGASKKGGRDSLTSTGLVWNDCDGLVELKTLGITGLMVQKASEYRDTIKDALEELQQWQNGEDLDHEGQDALLGSDDEGVEGDEDTLDDVFHAKNSMPTDRPEFSTLLEDAIGKVKRIVILYNALDKRRMKTFKVSSSLREKSSNVKRLEQVMAQIFILPDLVDDLAAAFYDLDEDEAKRVLSSIVQHAEEAISPMMLNWDEKEDQFTEWSKTWIKMIR